MPTSLAGKPSGVLLLGVAHEPIPPSRHGTDQVSRAMGTAGPHTPRHARRNAGLHQRCGTTCNETSRCGDMSKADTSAAMATPGQSYGHAYSGATAIYASHARGQAGQHRPQKWTTLRRRRRTGQTIPRTWRARALRVTNEKPPGKRGRPEG